MVKPKVRLVRFLDGEWAFAEEAEIVVVNVDKWNAWLKSASNNQKAGKNLPADLGEPNMGGKVEDYLPEDDEDLDTFRG